MTVFLLAALVSALGGAYAVWQWQRSARRREKLFTFAVSRGWTFAHQDPSVVNRWSGPPFGVGERRRATSVIRGEIGGRALTAFDYAYDKTSRSNNGQEVRTTYRFAVVVVAMGGYLPSLQVTPESALQRLGDALGATNDIELESEDFNRRFRVSCRNPRFASDVLHPRTMQLLASRPPFAFRFEGADAIAWMPGGLEPLDLLARSATLDAVVRAVPEFVWKQQYETRAPDPRFGAVRPAPPGGAGT